MSNNLKVAKNGMGGSRGGKGRSDKTAVMKLMGKKLRRILSKKEIKEGLEDK